MTAQENEMARCTGEPRALGSGSVQYDVIFHQLFEHLETLVNS